MIFNVQRFSIHDGPGIRTTVFFKGCTLRCRWCNNPEGIAFDYQLLYDRSRCISCLNCVDVRSNGEITYSDGEIKIHREKIDDCSAYRGVCPTGALTVAGEDKSTEEIIEQVQKDSPFFTKSGGGVTLSGGEPLAQRKMLIPFLQRCHELKINVCVETSLHTDWHVIEDASPYIDIFLADLKHTDERKFKEYTNGNLRLILDNFKRLAGKGAETIVRVPVIPTFNDTLHEMEGIIDFATRLRNVREIHFIPYHTLGLGKYSLLEKKYDFTCEVNKSDHDIEQYMKRAEGRGLKAQIGG